jgi:O-antigen/teichoic acid export membrane protein
MSTPKKIFQNIFSLAAAEISARFLGVIYSIYLARALGVENFGIFGASKYFTLFFMLLATLGLDAIGTREIAKNPLNIRKIVNNIFTMRIISALCVYSFLFIIVIFLDKPFLEKIVILIFGLNILTNNTLLNWAFQGMERMTVFAVRTIMANILNFFGILIFIHSPKDLVLSSVVVSATLVINTVWMIILYNRDYGRIKFEFDFPLWKEFLKQGIPIGFTFFIIGLYNYQGIVFLNFLTNNYYTGLYNAAFSVLLVATILSNILQQVYYPVFAKNTDLPSKSKSFLQFTKLTFPVGTFVPLFLFVFADKIIFFFGRDYSNSITSIRIMMVAVLFIYLSITFFAPLLAWKHEKKVIYANITGLFVNFIANLLLIPIFAHNGAATATLLSEISVFIVFCIIFYSIIKKLYLGAYLKYFSIAIISTIPFMFIRFEGFNNLILMFLSFGIFIALNFLFKTLNIQEIKLLLKKNEI